MKNRLRGSLTLAVLACALLLAPSIARAQIHLDMSVPPRNTLPGECTPWHELYPSYCTPWHQGAYKDNGNKVIDVCDHIWLGRPGEPFQPYHITWVGPTYFLRCLQNPAVTPVFEPMDPYSGGSPVCQIWHEIYPEYSNLQHVEQWEDADQSGDLSVCDIVWIKGLPYHLERIGLDITVTPGPSAAERSSWGKVKGFLGDLF